MPKNRSAVSSQIPILFALTGDRELDAKLRSLDRAMQSRIGRSAVGAGLTVLVKAQKAAAPTKRIRQAIGKSNKTMRATGLIQGKAGVNVGKKPARVVDGSIVSRGRQFPQAHLIVLGTKPRYTKPKGGSILGALRGARGAYRGLIRPHRFIESASMGAMNEAAQVAAAKAWDLIAALAQPELKPTA